MPVEKTECIVDEPLSPSTMPVELFIEADRLIAENNKLKRAASIAQTSVNESKKPQTPLSNPPIKKSNTFSNQNPVNQMSALQGIHSSSAARSSASSRNNNYQQGRYVNRPAHSTPKSEHRSFFDEFASGLSERMFKMGLVSSDSLSDHQHSNRGQVKKKPTDIYDDLAYGFSFDVHEDKKRQKREARRRAAQRDSDDSDLAFHD